MCRIIFKVFRNVFILENIKTIIGWHYFASAKTVVAGNVQEKVGCAFALQQVLSWIIKRLFRSIPCSTNHKLSSLQFSAATVLFRQIGSGSAIAGKKFWLLRPLLNTSSTYFL